MDDVASNELATPGIDTSPRRLTVAICTWNRAPLLRQTLERITRLTIPRGTEWELLVVDNNSTDDTQSILREFSTRLPLRALSEPRQGKSHALNLAREQAKGQYILWTDDDVLVEPTWLLEYCRAFDRYPDAGIFGGRIRPFLEGTPPTWLVRLLSHPRVAGAYGVNDLGPTPRPLSELVMAYGANMAVRTDVQQRYPYDTRIGPVGKHYVQGEETALLFTMLAGGVSGWWLPGPLVWHVIPARHQTIAHLRRYFVGSGEGRGLRMKDIGARKLLDRPLYLLREAIEAELRFRYHRMVSPPEQWIGDLIAASEARGAWRAFPRGRQT